MYKMQQESENSPLSSPIHCLLQIRKQKTGNNKKTSEEVPVYHLWNNF